jgi:hypothetical protein
MPEHVREVPQGIHWKKANANKTYKKSILCSLYPLSSQISAKPNQLKKFRQQEISSGI